jgi:hypothetical protein
MFESAGKLDIDVCRARDHLDFNGGDQLPPGA